MQISGTRQSRGHDGRAQPLTARGLAAAFMVFVMLASAPLRADQVQLPDMGSAASTALSISDEKTLGAEIMGEVRRQLPLDGDPELDGYIQSLGQQLVSHAQTPDFRFHFFVVRDNTINAFALPGGYIGVNTGLIADTRNESELAGVMSHEIAHVAQRHFARTLAAQKGSSLRTIAILLAAILVGQANPQAGVALATGGQAAAIQRQLNYTRAHEQEADSVGIHILAASGFDPKGMPEFFQRLLRDSQYQSKAPEFLSTHPLTEARIAETLARARTLPQGTETHDRTYGLMRAKLTERRFDRNKEALSYFQDEIRSPRDFNATQAAYGLALAETDGGKIKAAEDRLKRLIHDDGEYVPYYTALARAQAQGKHYETALKTLRTTLGLFPGDYAATVYYVQTLIRAGQPAKAEGVARDFLDNRTEDPRFYHLLAQAADAAGHQPEAELAMSEYYARMGQTSLAMDQLKQVISSSEADHFQKSRAVARKKELEQRQTQTLQ